MCKSVFVIIIIIIPIAIHVDSSAYISGLVALSVSYLTRILEVLLIFTYKYMRLYGHVLTVIFETFSPEASTCSLHEACLGIDNLILNISSIIWLCPLC
jgi:hypothetical protein